MPEHEPTQDSNTPDPITADEIAPAKTPPDTLNARIGVLARRETEARLIKPLVDALAAEFGRERVLAVVRRTIIAIAQQQGAELVETMGGDDLAAFADSLRFWTKDDALEIDVLEQHDDAFAFNVTRCRYAELYRALGMAELGAVLSCNRDYALIEGFNGDVDLTRTQTIMEGAAYCDFRYRLRQPIELTGDAPADTGTADTGAAETGLTDG